MPTAAVVPSIPCATPSTRARATLMLFGVIVAVHLLEFRLVGVTLTMRHLSLSPASTIAASPAVLAVAGTRLAVAIVIVVCRRTERRD